MINYTALLLQLPIFISVFTGLKGMSELPVVSMQSGGLLWFTDLTVPDPYFVLPLLNVATFLIAIEVRFHTILSSSWNIYRLPVTSRLLLILSIHYHMGADSMAMGTLAPVLFRVLMLKYSFSPVRFWSAGWAYDAILRSLCRWSKVLLSLRKVASISHLWRPPGSYKNSENLLAARTPHRLCSGDYGTPHLQCP